MDDKVNLADKLALFTEHWQPKTVGYFNGNKVYVIKNEGEFVWHKHDDTDDLFLVLKGMLTMRLRDREVTIGPGELFVVPRGVEHCPYDGGGFVDHPAGKQGATIRAATADLRSGRTSPTDTLPGTMAG